MFRSSSDHPSLEAQQSSKTRPKLLAIVWNEVITRMRLAKPPWGRTIKRGMSIDGLFGPDLPAPMTGAPFCVPAMTKSDSAPFVCASSFGTLPEISSNPKLGKQHLLL